jgi:RNA polymerase sigma factor (TIGR02999 family)
MTAPSTDITVLLHRWGDGDRGAFDQLVPHAYDRLREMARRRLQHSPGASVNTTGLVHEVYLKLAEADQLQLRDRGHFLAFSARVMRSALTDQARARQAARRGGGMQRVESFDDIAWLADEDLESVTALDEALGRLEAIAPRQTRILGQRFFGGLSLVETAEAVGVSVATVKRELRSARAWLASELGGDRVFREGGMDAATWQAVCAAFDTTVELTGSRPAQTSVPN